MLEKRRRVADESKIGKAATVLDDGGESEPGSAASTLHERIGTVIANKYRLVGLLGYGGMGAVYVAEHLELPKKYAVKLLRPDRSTNPSTIRRFKREAFEAAATKHPGIVDVIDFGVTPDGSVYSVMELLDGHSIHRLLESGPLPIARAVDIAIDALDALSAAHDRGLIHRDIKPENLFYTRDDSGDPLVKVLDFGIAKVMADDAHLTQDGYILGTPIYMSHEQLRDSAEVDVRADIYSLGATLYEMLTGVPPVVGATMHDVMAKIIADQVTRDPRQGRPDTPLWLAEIVEHSLARDKTERFNTAREMREALVAGRESLGSSMDGPMPADIGPTTTEKASAPPATVIEDVSTSDTIDMQPAIAHTAVRYDTTSDPPDAERSLPPSEIMSRRQRASRSRWLVAALSVTAAAAYAWWALQSDAAIELSYMPPLRLELRPPPPPRMVELGGGELMMGSTPAEIEEARAFCRSQPYPRHIPSGDDRCAELAAPTRTVSVDPFYVDIFEVSNAAYATWLSELGDLRLRRGERGVAVVKDGVELVVAEELWSGLVETDGRIEAVADRATLPVTWVTWHGASMYCAARAKRLPNEAEWAYAARGPERRTFPWGNTAPDCAQLIVARAEGLKCGHKGEGPLAVDHPQMDRTAEGVWALGGSVREWVADKVNDNKAFRVVRGCGWLDQPAMCNAARRSAAAVRQSDPAVGFRCARAAPR